MGQKVPIPTEYQEQISLFQLAHLHTGRHPELKFLNGSLNGVRLSIGQAVKAKKAGMRAGFPDISLPVRSGIYGGLFIELKRMDGGKISPSQQDWKTFLESQGYKHAFSLGHEEAWDIILKYLCL